MVTLIALILTESWQHVTYCCQAVFAAAMMRPHEVQFTDILRRNTLEVNVKVTMAVLMVSLNRVYTLYISLFKIPVLYAHNFILTCLFKRQ
jgi:hypothetical protein